MPHTTEEKIHLNRHRVFTTLVLKRTTTWTLGELLKAADVPTDYKINDEYHRDDYDSQINLDRESIVACREEYFDGITGKPLKKVKEKREVTHIEWEDAYEPDDGDGVRGGSGVPNAAPASG